ncbi:hypothetical protein BO443_240027 [Burkholderia orbicola]
MDKDAIVDFDGLTICIARVIEPTRAVSPLPTIDHASVRQPEEVSVTSDARLPVLPGRSLPRDQFALVFENPLAGFERLKREYAAPVHGRTPDHHTSLHDLPFLSLIVEVKYRLTLTAYVYFLKYLAMFHTASSIITETGQKRR